MTFTHTLNLDSIERDANGTIKGGIISTSGNVRVSLMTALRVFPYIRRAHDNARAVTCHLPVSSYTLRSIDAQGNITVGCHNIAWSEIERVANECGAFNLPAAIGKDQSVTLAAIPFDGFSYGSPLESELESCEAREAEYWPEREKEEGTPEYLEIDESDYAEILSRHSDTSDSHGRLARDWAEGFDRLASRALDFPLGLTFDAVDSSARGNDAIYCTVSRCVVRKLFRMSRTIDSHKEFLKQCDESAIEKDWYEIDAGEIGALITACLIHADEDDMRMSVYYWMAESSCFDDAWSECVDWRKVESDIAELRAEKQQEWEEENESDEAFRERMNPFYLRPQPRCEFTRDMFADNATH